MPKAYAIVRMTIRDPEAFKQYSSRTPAIVANHGGRYLVLGGRSRSVEGPEDKRRIVLIEFPDWDAAERCYYSPEYQDAKRYRETCAIFEFLVVEGAKP